MPLKSEFNKIVKIKEKVKKNALKPQRVNIHVDNEKDALGLAFKDILNSIGLRQHVSGPTHCRNHTLDLILSDGINIDAVEILQQSDDISDHYLVLCKLHLVKGCNANSVLQIC